MSTEATTGATVTPITSAVTPTAPTYVDFDDILNNPDIQYDTHTLQTGGSVMFRSLDAGTMVKFVQDNEDIKKRETSGYRLVLQSLVIPETKAAKYVPPVGTDAEIEAFWTPLIEKFRRMGHKEVNELVKAVMKFNGMGKTEPEVDAEKKPSEVTS
jgi:hypothetical protein